MLEISDLSEMRAPRHPSDKCLYGCAACGELHDGGNCPMEKIYNMLRRWYVPTKHAGMLPPPDAEKILNRTLARLEPGTSRAFWLCIYAFIEKEKVDTSVNRLTG